MCADQFLITFCKDEDIPIALTRQEINEFLWTTSSGIGRDNIALLLIGSVTGDNSVISYAAYDEGQWCSLESTQIQALMWRTQ